MKQISHLAFNKNMEAMSPGTPVSTTNKTDGHNITEILLKVASNTVTITPRNCTSTALVTVSRGSTHKAAQRR
jgi:hypothetical protein